MTGVLKLVLVAALMLLPNFAWAQAGGGVFTSAVPAMPGGSTTQLQYNKSSAFAGNVAAVIYDTAIAQPGAPTLATVGTPGSTTYYYSVTPLAYLGMGISSAAVNIATGNATLNSSNYVNVTTAAVTGSSSCEVFATNNTNGIWRDVGNVACGSVLADQGQGGIAIQTAPYLGGNLVDGTAGIGLTTNLKVNGLVAIGGQVPGYNSANTSGQSQLVVTQTATGVSGQNNTADPTTLDVFMQVQPAANGSVQQAFAILGDIFVPSSVTTNLNALEGTSGSILVRCTCTINSADAVNGALILGSGVTNPGGAIDTSYLSGGNFTVTAGNQAVHLVGVMASLSISGSTGTVTEADGFRFNGTQSGNGFGGTTVTAMSAYSAGAIPGAQRGNISAFESFHSEDNHLVGTTSYGVHIKGTAFKSLYEGPVLVGSEQGSGARFTCSGAGCSPVAGATTQGTFTTTTTGTATITVTMGASQTSATGWACAISDQTTANLIRETGSTTTTVTFSGVTVSGDTLVFGPCVGY